MLASWSFQALEYLDRWWDEDFSIYMMSIKSSRAPKGFSLSASHLIAHMFFLDKYLCAAKRQ